MKSIEFFGAAGGEVTGSASILTSSRKGNKLLVDYGMFQGSPKNEALNYEKLLFDPKELSAVLLTHPHLDHCGRLPNLVQKGYQGKFLMTKPTADIIKLILEDTVNIAKQRKERPPFNMKDVRQTLEQVKIVPLNKKLDVGDFKLTFRDAQHVAGSSSIEVTEKDSEGGQTILFSGDLGANPEDTSGRRTRHADVVVMETTYGNKVRGEEDPLTVLYNEIRQIKKNDGTLLIPTFAVHRAQHILWLMSVLESHGRLNGRVPVFFDSPMGMKVTEIYRKNKYHPFFDNSYGDPFTFNNLVPISTYQESETLSDFKGPKIIIAGAGMMNGGRIRRHAISHLPEENSRILFVGFCTENTTGREIRDGAKTVWIDNWEVPVAAHVSATEALSSHLDQNGLIDWLQQFEGVSKVILNHGENPQREAIASRISSELGIKDVALPQLYEKIDL